MLRDIVGKWESQSLLIFQSKSIKAIARKLKLLFREEFVSQYASGRLNSPSLGNNDRSVNVPRREIKLEDLPAEVDWRQQGVISGVRDQGMCGSCWAFAAASAMASYAKINDMSHQLLELSPQHLVRYQLR